MALAEGEDNPFTPAAQGLRRLLAAARARWQAQVDAERARLPLWAPVLAGLGTWAFFALPREPSGWAVGACLAAAGGALVLSALGRLRTGLVMAAALMAAGFASAALRTQAVSAPLAPERLEATVEGTVAEISRSRGDRLRVELADLVAHGLDPSETPERVRVTVIEGAFARKISLGDRIAVFARIGPPQGPVEPGGFDFRRHAYFDSLGGIGYAMGPAMASEEVGAGGVLPVIRAIRGRMTDAILAALPGREGGFAAALITGSRAEVRHKENQDLRDSNLAHLLSISGMHMGLLAGLSFAVVRLGVAAVPGLAVRVASKKLAAAAALAVATGYLMISGAEVATQRAYIMAAAALCAVLIDRPAISLRAVAAAALVILLLMPESLFNAGFQMSFAATIALVAVYEEARERRWLRSERGGLGRAAAMWAAGLLLTSFVAGAATSPYAAAHFNRMTTWGLPANLAAAPVMAFWVAPMGALAGLLAPFGLHSWALTAMGWGIEAILQIAHMAASAPQAVRPVHQPPAATLPLLTLGALWLVAWRTKLRWLGLPAMGAALLLWTFAAHRPAVLIAPEGAAIGVLGPEGRAVDRSRGAGYPIETWLQHDGDSAEQSEAAARPGLERGEDGAWTTLSNGWRVALIKELKADERLADRCGDRMVLISWAETDGAGGRDACIVLGRTGLARLGAVSVEPEGEGVRIRGALEGAPDRLWLGGGD